MEDRRLLSVAATTVGIGAPVLAVFNDPTATAATTFSAQSTNPDVTATVLHTSEELKMKVHTVNADGTTGATGEMDFLLLDDYAPNNIAHITSLANSGFYNGLTFNRILSDLIQGGDPGGGGGSGPNTALAEHDDEFNVDIRFTTPGLLALANNGPDNTMFPGSRPDTNDCQFFVTSAPYRDGDYQYTIIGKLVAGDDILQAVESVPVQDNGSGEISEPVNPPIIDSVSVVPDTQYGLVMLKAGSAATTGETASVSVTASDASPVTLTAADGSSQAAINVVLAQDTPSLNDRPAFIENVPDVYTSVNTPVTVSVPVAEGDAGVALSYGAQSLPAGNPNLQATASGTGPTDGSMTVTPGATPGVYSVLVGVWRNSTQSSANMAPDLQTVAVFVRPAAPTASLSVTLPPGVTTISDHPIFHVTGVSNGMNVGIFVDDNPDPIGTSVVTGTSVDVRTTATLSNGPHTFSVRQSIQYSDTTVGNRDIPKGTLYSDPSANTLTATVAVPPTAQAATADLTLTSSTITFKVTYSSPNDTILLSTIDGSDVRVTGPSSFDRPAALLSDTPNSDGSVVTATYQVDTSGSAWDITQNASYTIAMQAQQVSDSHGNYVAAGTLLTFNSDITPPVATITLATGQADPTNSSPINFTVTFSEAVTDFVVGDVTIGGTAGATTATITPVGSDGTTYNVAIDDMANDGTATIDVPAGEVHDLAGNLNAASIDSDNSVTYDTTPPVATITLATGQADPTNSSPINFTVIFSEAVTDFVVGDVTIGGTAGATTATITPVGSDGTTYNVAIDDMANDGTATIDVPAGEVHDLAGNLNAASIDSDNSVTYDTTPPVATITLATGQADPTNSSPINFTVIFSEAVTDFVVGDVTIGGTAGATTATITPVGSDGTTYNVAIDDMANDGTATIDVPAGEVHDLAGNLNAASIDSDNSVTYDTTPPTATIDKAAGQADPSNDTTVNFTVTFSEPVVGFTSGSVTVSGTAGATTAVVTSTDSTGTTYNIAVSGMTQDGTVVIGMPPGAAYDLAGNPSAAPTVIDNSVTVDITQPTVTIDEVNYQRPTTTSPINFKVVFSDPASDFTSADVTLTCSRSDTLVAIVTGSGTTYNVAVSGMTGDATVTASIAAGAAHDAVGNANVASTSSTVNGHADNVVEYLIAPSVGSIVVAEAGAVKNGILASNEPLKITWAASSHYGIVSQTMTLDGRTIAPINGPYSGLYYLCSIGTIGAGTHTYTIRSTDLRGISTTETGTFNVTAVGPLAITSVVVAEASTPKNGILDPKDSLKITWAASSGAGKIVSQTMTVDGRAIAPINGPYSGLYYLCPIGSWPAGTHSYAIHATDAKGNTANSTGTFTVVALPTGIYSVVVAEAGTVKNGILESNEPLKITWAASATTAIASQTITVDSGMITPINGPYSGLYYSCPIGTWAAGTHTYIIHATDTRGVLYSTSGTFVVVSPLMVGASAAPQGSAAMLSDAQLAPIAAEAVQRLEAQLGNQVETAMAGVQIKVANLSPGMLGETSGKTIWIDDNAAGYGWFVDPTPGDDVEFADAPGTHTLTALPGTAADQHVDLLTTVMHEMGHVLGYQHAADDLMQAVLPLGARRTLLD